MAASQDAEPVPGASGVVCGGHRLFEHTLGRGAVGRYPTVRLGRICAVGFRSVPVDPDPPDEMLKDCGFCGRTGHLGLLSERRGVVQVLFLRR